MGYLARLKKSEKVGYEEPKETKQLSELNCLGFLGTSPGGLEKSCPKNKHASRWWLLHFVDREPVEVACFPDVTHAEILERHPEAIAAEPINRVVIQSTTSCSTCEHVTRRGGCGEPVAAGLSDVVGTIRYSPDQGATCPAWLAAIPCDLLELIQAQAERFGFDDDDVALMHQAARSDPDGLRVALAAWVAANSSELRNVSEQ